jgi:hypothetical protein
MQKWYQYIEGSLQTQQLQQRQQNIITETEGYSKTYVDSDTGTGQWLEAVDRTADIEERCYGRRTGGLRRELVNDKTWVTELRAADQERTRLESTSHTRKCAR